MKYLQKLTNSVGNFKLDILNFYLNQAENMAEEKKPKLTELCLSSAKKWENRLGAQQYLIHLFNTGPVVSHERDLLILANSRLRMKYRMGIHRGVHENNLKKIVSNLDKMEEQCNILSELEAPNAHPTTNPEVTFEEYRKICINRGKPKPRYMTLF